MIQKRTLEKRTLEKRKKSVRREGDLHPLLQAVTHLAQVAMRPEKEKNIK